MPTPVAHHVDLPDSSNIEKGSDMTIKSILAAYSSEDAHGSGVKHAIKLAQLHGAWLTGCKILRT